MTIFTAAAFNSTATNRQQLAADFINGYINAEDKEVFLTSAEQEANAMLGRVGVDKASCNLMHVAATKLPQTWLNGLNATDTDAKTLLKTCNSVVTLIKAGLGIELS